MKFSPFLFKLTDKGYAGCRRQPPQASEQRERVRRLKRKLSYFNYTYDYHKSYFSMIDNVINYNNDYSFIRDNLANPFQYNREKRLPELLK